MPPSSPVRVMSRGLVCERSWATRWRESIMRGLRCVGRGSGRRLWRASGALVLAAGLGGCGDRDGTPVLPTYEVKGRVLLAGGQPLRMGRVYFVPKTGPALAALGEVASDGSFALTTYKAGDGAVPG